ncbi:unnamed protein product [Lupinus luteus]|uniref:non-specific serine/threonine protein kinase n=1 Tax=Lupinus luteus TaxID=3873 RepID=A0AAV1XZC9_LUPLU
MWKFKPFTHKEPTRLKGRSIDVSSVKIHVQKAIVEGGFSCVYLARDVVLMSKQCALKHIICNDEESLALVKNEISMMKSLVGHPNIVTLYAHTIFDMGRTKEAFLVMEFCEKSLVTVLESRGAAYFDEKQILLIFRDDKTEWKTPSSEPKSWKAFHDEPRTLNSVSADNTSKSVRTRNGQHNKHAAQLATDFETWGFRTCNFSAVGAGSPRC